MRVKNRRVVHMVDVCASLQLKNSHPEISLFLLGINSIDREGSYLVGTIQVWPGLVKMGSIYGHVSVRVRTSDLSTSSARVQTLNMKFTTPRAHYGTSTLYTHHPCPRHSIQPLRPTRGAHSMTEYMHHKRGLYPGCPIGLSHIQSAKSAPRV